MITRHVKALVGALVFTVLFSGAYAFKHNDFKKCETSAFCARSRAEMKSYARTYELSKVQVSGSKITAVAEEPVTKAHMQLEVTAYVGGKVRVKMIEPGSGRYEVQDVLSPTLASQEVAWEVLEQTKGETAVKISGTEIEVSLLHRPMEVAMYVNNEKQLLFNSEQKFFHELQARARQPNDPEEWYHEKFNSHSENKKYGKQNIAIDVTFPAGEEVYGIPERATSMALRPTLGPQGTPVSEPYRMYNLDVFEYLSESPFGLYGSIPFMMAHGKDANGVLNTVGMLWLNAAEMYVDIKKQDKGQSTYWYAESGTMDLFFFAGPTPAKVIEQYSQITSTTTLPPLFATGYHQCRWNYRDELDVDNVDAGFDTHEMPYDVIWLDIEHTDGKKYFTWDSRAFPTPLQMQEKISNKSRKMVTIVDPHIKRDSGYKVHTDAVSKNYYVKTPEGKDYEGWCWPGSSSYLDFTNPEVRQYWSGQFALDSYKGSTMDLFTWNDMNEPSVFNGPEVTMPKNMLHMGQIEHRDVHNLYGYYHHQATAQGLAQRGPGNVRPFVLSRAFFAGTQAIGPIWTGDNAAEWDHLEVSIPMLLTLSLSGLPYSGADVGGFFGNPDALLLTRWYQLGTYYPFFRGHAHQETKRREPWLFGDPYTSHIRTALRERYRILPYIYTLFYHASLTNAPLMRPVMYEFPEFYGSALLPFQAYKPELQFLLGPAILVRPVVKEGEATNTLLPGCSWQAGVAQEATCVWYHKSTGKQVLDTSVEKVVVDFNDLDSFPVFYRGGYIIPMRERARRSSAAQHYDPYTLNVAVGADLTAEGDLYEDDGITTAHNQGAFIHRRFSYQQGTISCTAGNTGNGASIYTSTNKIERIRLLLPTQSPIPKSASTGGSPLTVTCEDNVCLIQKPNLPIASDWQISLQF